MRLRLWSYIMFRSGKFNSINSSLSVHLVLAAVMRDGATVSAAAIRTVIIMYPDVLNARCIFHNSDFIGDKFKHQKRVSF